jgi:antitoxin (DNA-binding transcriptional repressor) of toxin-antitoxin stability system
MLDTPQPPIYINVHEAKTHLSKYLHMVEAGREVFVQRGNKTIARIEPLAAQPARELHYMKGKVSSAFFEPMTQQELAEWGMV